MTTVTTLQKASFTAGLLMAAIAGLVLGCGTDRWHWAVPQKATEEFPPLAHLPFGPGEELEFKFGWNGMIAVAGLATSLSSTAENGQEEFVLAYEGKTAPILNSLWRCEASGKTFLDPHTLQPRLAEFATRTGSRQKTIETRYDWPAGVATSTIQKSRRGQAGSPKQVQLKPTLDIPSIFLLMRADAVPSKTTRTLKVLNGDTVYEVTLTPVGKERVTVAAGSFDACQYDVGVRELKEKDESADETQPVQYRSVRAWLDEKSRMPLKIEAQISFGQVYAELVRYHLGEAR